MAARQGEDRKAGDQSAAHIIIKVQWISEMFASAFRIKRRTPLKKLMHAYCDKKSVHFNSLSFLFDGCRVRPDQTADELNMEDGDQIDALSILPCPWCHPQTHVRAAYQPPMIDLEMSTDLGLSPMYQQSQAADGAGTSQGISTRIMEILAQFQDQLDAMQAQMDCQNEELNARLSEDPSDQILQLRKELQIHRQAMMTRQSQDMDCMYTMITAICLHVGLDIDCLVPSHHPLQKPSKS